MTATILEEPRPGITTSFNLRIRFSIDMEAIAEDGHRSMWEWLGSQFLGEKYDQQSDLVLICH